MNAELYFTGPQPGPDESPSDALHRDAERRRLLAETSLDLLTEVTPDGQLLYVSSNARTVLGFPPEELIGTNIRDHVHPDDLPEVQMRSAFPKRGPITCRLQRKDGSWSWFDLIERSYALGHEEQRVVLIARDVSRSRNAEAECDRLATALRRAEKLAALGTLAGGVAHDFNNILTAMMAYASLARADTRESSVIESLTQVLKAAERAKNLTRQILNFRSQRKQAVQPVALAGLVQEVLNLLRPTFPSSVEVVTELASEPGIITADPTQIHQVVVNLCTNAVYAMQERPGRLEIRLTTVVVDEDFARALPGLFSGTYARLSVIDTGHGMDADTRRRIFEPLFSTKQPSEGTGLGLAVVHRIVTDHGGAIQVSSRPGAGSTFHVFLPISQRQRHAGKLDRQLRGSGERVLFVDDEAAICTAAAKILEVGNYAVTTFRDPREALDLLRSQAEQFDLVIADFAMPGLTGAELTAEILKLRPRLPVLLTSGAFGTWTVDDAKRVGCHSLLPKPFTVEALLTAARDALRREISSTAAPCPSSVKSHIRSTAS